MNEKQANKQINALMEKLEALQRLSSSSNPNEAALAAAKMQELCTKYNIDVESVKGFDTEAQKEDYQTEVASLADSLFLINWRRTLLGIIAKHNFCHAFYFDNTARMKIFGQPHNIRITIYLYTYISKELYRLAHSGLWTKDVEKHGHINHVVWERSFYAGAVNVIYQRLEEGRAKWNQNVHSRSIISVLNHDLDQAFRMLYEVKSVNHASAVSRVGYESGWREGSNLEINPGIDPGSVENSNKFLA